MRLRNEAELSRKEAVLCRKQLLDLQTNHDAILAQQRASLQDGRQQAKSRVAELECRLTSLHAKFDKAAAVHKKAGAPLSAMRAVLSVRTVFLPLFWRTVVSRMLPCRCGEMCGEEHLLPCQRTCMTG